MNKKIDFSLLVAILIPILMILFVAGSIYLPGFFVKPKYSFLYYYEGNYSIRYVVKDGSLAKIEPTEEQKKYKYYNGIDPTLFLYDAVKNESKEVSFEYAKTFTLDSNSKSPDGFTIEYGNRSGDGFFPFFFYSGTDYNTRFLKGNNVSKKINLRTDGSYYNFHLLGWIK